MTRQIHDQLAKQFLTELLQPYGEVETSREISSEVQQIDVWFVPRTSAEELQWLGEISRMVVSPCLFEAFRNAPTDGVIRTCLKKLYLAEGEISREARRNKVRLPKSAIPKLWILSPSLSQTRRSEFKADPDASWLPGFYFLGKGLNAAIVAIDQLPVTESTLPLRILGKGATQATALAEVANLPPGRLKEILLRLLANWRKTLEIRQNRRSRSNQELFMSLSPLFLQWEAETLDRGRREVISSLLKAKFGQLDPELEQRIPTMLQIPMDELAEMVLRSQREDLLTQFPL